MIHRPLDSNFCVRSPTPSPPECHQQFPINELPIELLGEIFAHAICPEDEPRFTTYERGVKEYNFREQTILSISHTCNYWRDVALLIPELWSHLHIVGPNEGCLRLVRLFLQRSGNAPTLDLRLHQIFRADTWPDEFVKREVHFTKQILALWFAHARRWRSIDLHLLVDGSLDFDLVQTLTPASMRHVEAARLQFSWFTYENALQDAMWNIIATSPVLTEARWKYRSIPYPPSFPGPYNLITPRPLSLPYARLAKLQLRNVMVDDFLAFLPQCTRVQWIDLAIVGVIDYSMNKLTVPTLQTVCVHGASYGISVLLDHLITPNLKRLEVGPMDVNSSCISRLLIRSQCSLEHLALPEDLSEETLLSMFQLPCMASVKRLAVGYRITQKLLLALTLPDEGQAAKPVLPLLQDILIRRFSAPDGVLLAMVQSRFREDGSGLKVLDVRVDEAGNNFADVEGLFGLVLRGLTMYWLGQGHTIFNDRIEVFD
ncbi:hypothetical protein BDN72DRAFT_406185 [Pluteus cervinus]|uniref:Uncharacterized protein n=1 Tax=Pluteus cervinus TaxID=181527 RepID=A0ACD3A8X2_9AGAR|nr:hypothetical protein BDN72DRAFT_406185 [Pluteus cervinus]